MRRMISLFAAFMLVLVLVPMKVVAAEAAPPPAINAGSFIMIDDKSGAELYGDNETDRIYPASTTKLMTAILAIESGKLDDMLTCGNEIKVKPGSSVMKNGAVDTPLVAGEEIKLKDLLYGMLLVSGNDAAAAAAVYLGGSIEGFAEKMNAKARELGMDDTHFVNPHGVQDIAHYSTAADMAKLAQYCMKNETFRQVVDTTDYTVPATNKTGERRLSTTNKLISKNPENAKYNYNGAIGIKTGLTPTANGCLIAAAKRDNMELIVCIYNDKDPNGLDRWGIAKKLFDYGFSNFATVDITNRLSQVKVPSLKIGSRDIAATAVFDSGDQQYYTAEKDKVSQIGSATITAVPAWTKKEDIKKGDQIGVVAYKIDENTIVATAKLMADQDFAGASADNGPDPSNTPASTADPHDTDSYQMTDATIVAIVIVIVASVAGIIMLVVLLMRRKKKAINGRNARKRSGSNGHYNYRRKF